MAVIVKVGAIKWISDAIFREYTDFVYCMFMQYDTI